jgi:hypothetical protein
MRVLRAAVFSCCAVAVAGWLVACGTTNTKTKDIAFCVGTIPVTQDAVAHWKGVLSSLSPGTVSLLSHQAPSAKSAQGFLTAATRAIGEARELGVSVPSSEVDTTLERLRYEPDKGGLKGSLRSREETEADRRELARLVLLGERLWVHLRRQVEADVPASALKHYYDRHENDFQIPQRRDALIVVNHNKKQVELAKRELASGKSPVDVLRMRNDEPEVGGIHRDLQRGHTPRTYEERVFAVKPGVIVGPLKVVIYYLFEVLEIKPPRQQSETEVNAIIRHRLVSAAVKSLLEFAFRRVEARWPLSPRCGIGPRGPVPESRGSETGSRRRTWRG